MTHSALKKLLAATALVLAGLFGLLNGGSIQPPENFSAAKQIAREIYAGEQSTFYCGCRYNGSQVDLASCGYQVRKNANRAARLEWEHVVPAWVIGHQRQCWQQGGRDNCTRNDPTFARAEADLHNLVPAIGEVNGDRSNFPLTMLDARPTQYGQCAMVVDFKTRKAMPPEPARGPAARIYLYMHERYQLRLSSQDRQLYEAWHRMYPPTAAEQARNQRIACQMGWGNPWVGEVNMAQCGASNVLGGVLSGAQELLRSGPPRELAGLLAR
ncbi:endonuclease I family protein [Pseudomonas sp. NW5]|uniref:endonuclease n=1 Tax=Pseudomonas sp. NW5 TaxID=2934934 RepID=UPI002020348A|nr:endonuclease I family protein [Pseudomonas sp. NW5]MCL7463254.1 endonuclease I family protein [Pseudomonas sp. NW5]